MREILFKARSLDNGEWVEGFVFDNDKSGEDRKFFIGRFDLFQYSYKDYVGWDINGHYICEVDPATVCQYTGLTDKNGVKIFENDVVLYEYIGVFGENNSYKYTVEWDGYGFTLFDDCGFDPKGIAVIGNIHDEVTP